MSLLLLLLSTQEKKIEPLLRMAWMLLFLITNSFITSLLYRGFMIYLFLAELYYYMVSSIYSEVLLLPDVSFIRVASYIQRLAVLLHYPYST